jgi:hypothetical protein
VHLTLLYIITPASRDFRSHPQLLSPARSESSTQFFRLATQPPGASIQTLIRFSEKPSPIKDLPHTHSYIVLHLSISHLTFVSVKIFEPVCVSSLSNTASLLSLAFLFLYFPISCLMALLHFSECHCASVHARWYVTYQLFHHHHPCVSFPCYALPPFPRSPTI